MAAVTYKKGPFQVAEIWFEPKPDVNADIVRCVQVAVCPSGVAATPFHSLTVDLSAPDDVLLKRMDRGTRYEIRRALDKDALHYDCLQPRLPDEMETFVRAYDEVIGSRDDMVRLNATKLRALVTGRHIYASSIKNGSGEVLTWHVHVLAHGIARLLYSVSANFAKLDQERRNLNGRANRLHHWRDMQYFRDGGCRQYDFGGYYNGKTDEKKLQINKFKSGFGGEVAVTFNCIYPMTLKGRAGLAAARLLGYLDD